MSTSFPYLALSRCIGADYGRVLAIADKLDKGWPWRDINDPMAWNVMLTWKQERDRRNACAQ